MSFIKSLLIAIFASLLLTYVFGLSLLQFFDLRILHESQEIEPLRAISVSALLVVALVITSLSIVLSVFGVIIFTTLMIFAGLFLMSIGFFWPIIIIAIVLWICLKDNASPAS